jgi:hypothetical protein
MAANNSKPARPALVVRREDEKRGGEFLRLIPAVFISIMFNGGLLAALFFISSPGEAVSLEAPPTDVTVQQESPDTEKVTDPLVTTDIDPAAQAPNQDINYNVERKAEVSVPGQVNPLESVGIQDGDKSAPPTNLPAPGGLGNIGQGGAIDSAFGQATSSAVGMAGGYGLKGMPLAGTFYGRSGATREQALINGGGTKESEAAVVRGLYWLKRNQASDGRWLLDGNFKDRGTPNDIAGTAFGLLPLLAAGKTHKPSKESKDFDKPVEKGLLYLIRKQNKRDGNFGGGMYAHGLATIAMCEAYGMTQDPALRRPAQMAVNYIVKAQHSAGGWRYSPGQPGDTSVVGWQVMALKSAQMAGLDVPEVTMRKAQAYLNSCEDSTNGYGYTGPGPTPTMSAVGLLCRQYLQSWGPQNLKLIKGVNNHLKTNPPGSAGKNIYYFYYATQVMHHFGGSDWKQWNDKMRDTLVKTQDLNGANAGSWDSTGDAHGGSGGRVMITSLSLLTLEVYYRHLPLYYREAGGNRVAAK